ADGDGALARIEAIGLRMACRGEVYELGKADALRAYTICIEERQPQLEARHTIRHLLEGRAFALRQLAFAPIGRMVGGVHVQRAVLQPAPARLLRLLVARRRRAAEKRALHAEVDVLRGEEEILRAGFAENLQPPRARLANRFDAIASRHAHDEDRAI